MHAAEAALPEIAPGAALPSSSLADELELAQRGVKHQAVALERC